MNLGFEVEAAKPKRAAADDDAPAQVPMRAGLNDATRRKPMTDDKRVRHQMQRQHAKTAAGEGGPMDTSIQREAMLLEAMAHATLDEQRQLAAELDAIRASRRTAFEDDMDTDLGDEIVADHLTPVLTHVLNTTATDWFGEVEDDAPDARTAEQTATAEASLWWGRVHEAVKADRHELGQQATGYARRYASQFGSQAAVAQQVFLTHVAHLARLVVAEDGQTCAVCGVAIERDPAGEDPRTWHHADGAKHDHEAKPSGGDKTSARRTAAGEVPAEWRQEYRSYADGGGALTFGDWLDKNHPAGKTSAHDLSIGGGDDWQHLNYADSDHEAVGPTVGNVSTCRVCHKGIVLDQDASGRYKDQTEPGAWRHVKAAAKTADVADLASFEVEAATDDPFAFEGTVITAERDRATNPQYGDQTACKTCGMDIEYHGPDEGWIGRGGDKYCDESGAHTSDPDNGASGDYPHQKHQPNSDRVASRTAAGDSPGQVDPEQSGEAKSTLPYDKTLADDWDPDWSEDWPSADQPVIDPPMTGAGEGATAAYNPFRDPESFYNNPNKGPHRGTPEDLFPEGGVPLHGDLTPEQEAWLHGRGRQRTAPGAGQRSAVLGERPWNIGYDDAVAGRSPRTASKDVGAPAWYYTEGYLAGLDGRNAAVGDPNDGVAGIPEEVKKLDDPDDRPMWPWDLEEPGSGAADVANAKNPNDHISSQRTAASEIEQAIREHAEHLQGTLKPGDRVGNATVTNVGSHTVQYRTDDGWEGSMQIPFTNGGMDDTMTPAWGRAMDEAGEGYDSSVIRAGGVKLAAFRATIQANLQVEAVGWGRRHYEDLASTIATHPERAQLATHFANALSGTNPNYRKDQFEKAAQTEGYSVRGGTGTANYSRGHYQHVADTIKSYTGDRAGVANHFADHFAQSNSRFDRGRFLKAAGG